jgi:hypothetical protein
MPRLLASFPTNTRTTAPDLSSLHLTSPALPLPGLGGELYALEYSPTKALNPKAFTHFAPQQRRNPWVVSFLGGDDIKREDHCISSWLSGTETRFEFHDPFTGAFATEHSVSGHSLPLSRFPGTVTFPRRLFPW